VLHTAVTSVSNDGVRAALYDRATRGVWALGRDVVRVAVNHDSGGLKVRFGLPGGRTSR